MARPSTEIIEKYNVIEQFQRCGLKTVINLQRPGEHASCGHSLDQESGFTYRPETFMKASIYYYNFGWKDYGVASLTTILDMVKVMSFAVQEGKLAVHCHAGLGRTGVLLACYLVFTFRMSADQAILFIRAKRPNSIQTRGQLLCVREFAQFLVPLRSVFSCAEPRENAVTLSQYLTRQQHLLHGYEARQMKNVPKIVQLVCNLLLDIAANRESTVKQNWPTIADLSVEIKKTVCEQALQQLGKEMRGMGIPVSPCLSLSRCAGPPQSQASNEQPLFHDLDQDTLYRKQKIQTTENCPLSNSRGLSYSDSFLYKHSQQQNGLISCQSTSQLKHQIQLSISHSSLATFNPLRLSELSAQDNVSITHDSNKETKLEACMAILEIQQHKRFPLDPAEQRRRPHYNVTPPAPSPNGQFKEQQDLESRAERGVKNLTLNLETELSVENRHLLVAEILAMDVKDKDVSFKVSQWQTELNSKEGAWERLCIERDPLVLSSLMWSWLEQLKDPVISSEDIKALTENDVNPKNALNLLEQGHRLTLLCVLKCAAQLQPMPKDVETLFLNKIIKVFTKIDPRSEINESLYLTLKAILTPVLHDLRDNAVEVTEDN
ncbi:protein tyrosine phosphatase domain-containing protein 1 isoform X2 [Cynoglossus semilaevis]|nr:protein tyrosine phosphatase domain-containing protein 1 isoform X2 [Cynoglossus semilaevis]